jgi:hypothetical protein
MIPLERALILVEKPLRNSIRVSMSEAAIAEVLSRYGMGMDFQSPSARGQSAGGPSAAGKVMTVRQFAESQPALSEGSVRWDLFNSKSNGLDQSGAILRRGKRILIDADLYMAWMRGAMR